MPRLSDDDVDPPCTSCGSREPIVCRTDSGQHLCAACEFKPRWTARVRRQFVEGRLSINEARRLIGLAPEAGLEGMMPHYTDRTDALREVIERQALRERTERLISESRKLGPVTAKAAHFDFGRSAPPTSNPTASS